MAVPLSGTVARLREAVSMETKIPTDQVISLLRPITHGSQKCCFLFFWNFVTVLSQTWLERNLKPVVSSVEGKNEKLGSKGEKYTQKLLMLHLIVYIYLKGKAMTLHQDLLSALFIKYN